MDPLAVSVYGAEQALPLIKTENWMPHPYTDSSPMPLWLTHVLIVLFIFVHLQFQNNKKDNKNLTQIMQSNSSHFWHETMAVLLVHKQCYKTDKLHTRMTHCHQQNTWHWKLWFSESKLWQLITQLHNRMTREATKYYPTFPDLLNSLTLPKFPGY